MFFPFHSYQDVCYDVARVYMYAKQYAVASKLFMTSIQFCGDHHASWLNRGVCLYHLHKLAEARFCFVRVGV